MAAGNVPPCRFFVCLIGQPGKAELGTVLTGAGMGMPLACVRKDDPSFEGGPITPISTPSRTRTRPLVTVAVAARRRQGVACSPSGLRFLGFSSAN